MRFQHCENTIHEFEVMSLFILVVFPKGSPDIGSFDLN